MPPCRPPRAPHSTSGLILEIDVSQRFALVVLAMNQAAFHVEKQDDRGYDVEGQHVEAVRRRRMRRTRFS